MALPATLNTERLMRVLPVRHLAQSPGDYSCIWCATILVELLVPVKDQNSGTFQGY